MPSMFNKEKSDRIKSVTRVDKTINYLAKREFRKVGKAGASSDGRRAVVALFRSE